MWAVREGKGIVRGRDKEAVQSSVLYTLSEFQARRGASPYVAKRGIAVFVIGCDSVSQSDTGGRSSTLSHHKEHQLQVYCPVLSVILVTPPTTTRSHTHVLRTRSHCLVLIRGRFEPSASDSRKLSVFSANVSVAEHSTVCHEAWPGRMCIGYDSHSTCGICTFVNPKTNSKIFLHRRRS